MLNNFKKYYLIGIGGVGMSSIAVYLLKKGFEVYGYDINENDLIENLKNNGAKIFFSLKLKEIPDHIKNNNTIIIYSSAIKKDQKILSFFIKNEFTIFKRSKFLSKIIKNTYSIAIAGTHGKTTTTAILSHLFLKSKISFTSFIGGFLNQIDSNIIINGDKYSIVEADEYDKSFLDLKPNIACITSVDSDHFDTYENFENIKESFIEFSNSVSDCLVVERDSGLKGRKYSIYGDADYFLKNISQTKNGFEFDIYFDNNNIKNVKFNCLGIHNLSNALGAFAIGSEIGLDKINLAKNLSSFSGVKRRFEIIYESENQIFIDDYAHHPNEIKSFYYSLDKKFPNSKKCVFFQPHLFTRTRDLMKEFAEVLNYFDKVYLLNIYPARENPIDGINSKKLASLINNSKVKLINKSEILDLVLCSKEKVISFLGAGDIADQVKIVKKYYENHESI
tara:strand:+ start:50286 stop:51632 length:1347 start_codon:yes stop_codon:yes gene_type:complete